MTLTAAEARALSAESLRTKVIAPYISHVEANIKAAAMTGKTSCYHPLAGLLNAQWPSPEAQEALWVYFQTNGFKVIHHPGGDSSNPQERPYTEIKWS